jgi:hypothetical protein
MGGGASGGSTPQPYDELGGQFASFSGGTPSAAPPNYAQIGQGIAQGGQKLGAGLQTNQSFQTSGPYQQQGAYAPAPMPQLIQTNQGANPQLMMALQRLLAQMGGGY